MNAYQNYLIVLGYLSQIVGPTDKQEEVKAALKALYDMAEK